MIGSLPVLRSWGVGEEEQQASQGILTHATTGESLVKANGHTRRPQSVLEARTLDCH